MVLNRHSFQYSPRTLVVSSCGFVCSCGWVRKVNRNKAEDEVRCWWWYSDINLPWQLNTSNKNLCWVDNAGVAENMHNDEYISPSLPSSCCFYKSCLPCLWEACREECPQHWQESPSTILCPKERLLCFCREVSGGNAEETFRHGWVCVCQREGRLWSRTNGASQHAMPAGSSRIRFLLLEIKAFLDREWAVLNISCFLPDIKLQEEIASVMAFPLLV